VIDTVAGTGLWRDARETPATLATTAERRDGARAVADLVGHPGVRRVVATGNGAAYYAAMGLWIATLGSRDAPCELVAVPAGLVARSGFRWREGDALLAFSSSGELRDLIEAIEGEGVPLPFGLVTSSPDSTLGRLAGASALVQVNQQRGVTHTQAFCGNVLAGLAIWAEVSGDVGLRGAVDSAADAYAAALAAAEGWIGEVSGIGPPPVAAVASTGPGWAAALEAALLLKEVARIPAEGVETREGATSVLMGLTGDALLVLLPTLPADPLLDECAELARSSGIATLRTPTVAGADPRLAAITTFPATLALAIAWGLRAGHDVDQPAWTQAYYATARRK
jgi:fructoselysine-6-P-deglycase FrlB-like protein